MTKRKKSNLKWFVGGGVILLAVLIISSLNFGDNVVYFYTPAEVVEKAPEIQFNTIKVGGMVKAGSINWDPENLKLSFILSNLKGIDIEVNHSGTPPDMFKENQGVVVEGKLDNAEASSITSKKLMVKHSEEYKIPEAHQKSQEKELLEKSIFKDEK